MALEVGWFLGIVVSILAAGYLYSDNEKRQKYNECFNTTSNGTGMKKLEELKNRLGNLAVTDDRPALWRLCRSLVESLDEVQKEHDAELEELREKVTAAEANSEECENECREAEEKVTELEGQLKAMSDHANSAMADARKWQNAYLNLKVETPIVQKTDATWYMNDQPVTEASVFAQQAHTAMTAQEERIPRNCIHVYRVKYYSYDDHRWHDTELWSDGIVGVEDWVRENCGGGKAIYDCKVIA